MTEPKLRGRRGITGGRGLTGPQGDAGPTGPSGATGPQGPPGTGGSVGPPGPQGPAGADGIDGMDGADGATGATGPQGPQGIQGVAGMDGADGADGAQGPQGIQGIQGPAGTNGTNGTNGIDGTSFTTGYANVIFNSWVSTANTHIYPTYSSTGVVGFTVDTGTTPNNLTVDEPGIYLIKFQVSAIPGATNIAVQSRYWVNGSPFIISEMSFISLAGRSGMISGSTVAELFTNDVIEFTTYCYTTGITFSSAGTLTNEFTLIRISDPT